MRTSSNELWAAGIAVTAITLAYVFMLYHLEAVPPASGFIGHSIGVLGFALMVMTETVYPLRKRRNAARWGRMSSWLDFHIFTGIVGPYMVLLHSAWEFHGLAGVVMLLTMVVVASGFVGRFFYTSIPRTIDGAEMEAGVLREEIRKTSEQIDALQNLQKSLVNEKAAQHDIRSLHRGEMKRLKKLTKRKRLMDRRIASLALMRRLLALWHAIHVPVGLTLFTAAILHILGAIYFATLLH